MLHWVVLLIIHRYGEVSQVVALEMLFVDNNNKIDRLMIISHVVDQEPQSIWLTIVFRQHPRAHSLIHEALLVSWIFSQPSIDTKYGLGRVLMINWKSGKSSRLPPSLKYGWSLVCQGLFQEPSLLRISSAPLAHSKKWNLASSGLNVEFISLATARRSLALDKASGDSWLRMS